MSQYILKFIYFIRLFFNNYEEIYYNIILSLYIFGVYHCTNWFLLHLKIRHALFSAS